METSQMLTLTEIENRLTEAAYALRAMSDRERGWLYRSYDGTWPDVVHDAIESYGWEMKPSRETTPGASNEAIDGCVATLLWLRHDDGWLDRDTSRLVLARASGVEWWRLEQRLWRFPRSVRKMKRGRGNLYAHYKRGLRRIQVRIERDARKIINDNA